jgi:hypothetical protein
MGAYAPLNAWLLGQPANIRPLPATFQQIEGILGRGLPAVARRKPQWWENCQRSSENVVLKKVTNVVGGFDAWRRAGLPTVTEETIAA